MALVAADLVFPAGALRASLFDDVTSVAADLLSAVVTEHPDATDAAVRQTVYARAFRAKADDLNAEAAELDVDDEFRRRRLQSQIAYFERRADEAEQAAAALLPAEAEPSPFAGWPTVHSLR